MADVLIDNGTLTDYTVSSKDLVGGQEVVATELVTAVEGGTRTDLAKAEDAPHATGDMGLMALAVRKDGAVTLAGADGDYVPLITDASGRLYVNLGGTGAADLGKAEDAVHASGDTGVMALAVRKDTAAATAGADGDYMPLTADSSGRLHVNIGAALAAARSTDSVAAAHSVDALMQNLTVRTPQFAAISASTVGNNTIVAAAGAGNMILVHQLFLVAAGTVTTRFQSGATGTALTGQTPLGGNGGFVLPFSPVGWFKTAANTLLNLELSASVATAGGLVYTVIT